MFGIGPLEMIAIVVFGLIMLGPERFPEAARGVGKAVGQFWSLRDEVSREMALSLEESTSPQFSASAQESHAEADVTMTLPGHEAVPDRAGSSSETALR